MRWCVVARSALSPEEIDEVWRRWRSGQAVKVLAREMRRHPSTVRDLLKRQPVRRVRLGSAADDVDWLSLQGSVP